jgi:DNA-binding IclR family transcriptional regulator
MALRAPTGDVLGALSIAAIDNRMDEARQLYLAGLLEREVRIVERRLYRRFAAHRGQDDRTEGKP